MNLNELPDMSEALKQVQEKSGCGSYSKGGKVKKLDPVGKEDGDIDNDGDKDESDSYLANRRKAIGKAMKKEAFYFSEEEFEGLEEIDEMTDEELIDTMVEAIVDLAEDDEDLLEIAEALEGVELLDEEVEQLDELLGGLVGMAMGNNPLTGMPKKSKGGKVKKKGYKKESADAMAEALERVHEVSDKYYDSAVASSKNAAKEKRVARMKGAAKEAGKRVRAGAAKGMAMAKPAAKAAAKGAAKGAGYAVGAAQRGGSSLKKSFVAGYKRGKEGAAGKKEAPKGESKPAAKEKKGSDDGTGGKLDALLASTRGTKSGSSGGGSSSASSGGGESEAPKAKKPGLLSRIGKGLKKAVGKTARAVSGGSDKLAKKLGEDYDEIAHLYESGLFTIEEIENVIEKKGCGGYSKGGSLKQARKNVGADKCWDGYKAKGTKNKGGKVVPNCVKEEDLDEKKLDPVGQEDGDVNNDGKKDSSDKYLMKRRKAIGKAIGMKKEERSDWRTEMGLEEKYGKKKCNESEAGVNCDEHGEECCPTVKKKSVEEEGCGGSKKAKKY